MSADPQRSLATRPHILRQRSQSAVTKASPLADVSNAVDSDASKKSSLRHRHAHSHHHIPHHPKRFAKDILGLQNGHSFAELSKQSSRLSEAPGYSATAAGKELNDSRKGSLAGQNGDGVGASTVESVLTGEQVERLVMQEQWKNKARESELKSALHGLSEDSMKTTRRLDDLYYNLLERLSGLRSTISNLQELSGLTAQLHGQFRKETGELNEELQQQIDAFAGFKTQQSKIDALDMRVKESRKRADGLSERMEAARKRVSALEVREKEWQDSVSWRLRWMYIILGTIIGIILAVCVLQYLGRGPRDAMAHPFSRDHATMSLESLTTLPTSVKSAMEEIIGTKLNTTARIPALRAVTASTRAGSLSRTLRLPEPTTPADQDPLLRIFDEL